MPSFNRTVAAAGLTLAGAAALTASFLQGPSDAKADRTFEFSISDDRVVPATDFAAQISVIGSALVDGTSDMPVTMSVRIGDTSHDLFGSSIDPVMGNLNDHSPARHVIIDQVFAQGDDIQVAARSWSGNDVYLTATTASPSDHIMVLRDGDVVPSLDGYAGQTSIAGFLAPYVDADTNTVTIDGDQIIYLFELGTSDLDSSAADFQDLVVLITLGESPEALATRDLVGYD